MNSTWIAMGGSIYIAIWAAVLGELSFRIWRSTPPEWLCDYGEEPGEEQRSLCRYGSGKRAFLYLVWLAAMMSFSGWEQKVDILFLLGAFFCLLQIGLGDWYFQIIPDQWLAGAGVCFGIKALLEQELFENAAQAAIVCLVIWIVVLSLWKWKGVAILGFGDVKLLFVLGLNGGSGQMFNSFIWASLLCGFWCAVGIVMKKITPRDNCPLGPYLVAGWCLQMLS